MYRYQSICDIWFTLEIWSGELHNLITLRSFNKSFLTSSSFFTCFVILHFQTKSLASKVSNTAEDSLIAASWHANSQRFVAAGTRGHFYQCVSAFVFLSFFTIEDVGIWNVTCLTSGFQLVVRVPKGCASCCRAVCEGNMNFKIVVKKIE